MQLHLIGVELCHFCGLAYEVIQAIGFFVDDR